MPDPDLSSPTLTVVPWADPVIDVMGHDPRSTYVERFWLAVLGPSTTWLVRHLSHRFEADPDGFTLHLAETASVLGLGHSEGRHSPLVRALHRSCQFGAARPAPDGALAVRRHMPPLTRRQVERLPAAVRAEHEAWRLVERDAATLDAQGRRARRLALALAELGEDVATTEQRLQHWHIHPVVARDAAVWARRLMAARAEGAPARSLPATTSAAPGQSDPLEALVGAGPVDLGGDAA